MQAIMNALKIILGDKDISYYLAGFFFTGCAIILSIYMHSRKRDVFSPSTPTKFSWRFLIWDNLKRMVVGFILMFLMFRLFDLSNVFAMVGVGFFLSFGLDKAIQWLMEKTDLMNFLKTDRENFPKNDK